MPDTADRSYNVTIYEKLLVVGEAQWMVPQKVIIGLNKLYEHGIKDLDMQGDLYEYMLGELFAADQNCRFRTPKHIRDMRACQVKCVNSFKKMCCLFYPQNILIAGQGS